MQYLYTKMHTLEIELVFEPDSVSNNFTHNSPIKPKHIYNIPLDLVSQDTEPADVEPPKQSIQRPSKKEQSQELGLGFVQISVTAATPMVEDADKGFLDDIKEDDESDDAHSVDRESLEKDVAEVVDEILEEASMETHKKVAAEAARAAQERQSKQKPSVTIVDAKRSSGDGASAAASSTVGSIKPKKEPVRSGPPSVPPPPPPVVQQQSLDDNKFEANFDDAQFDANFDDAFDEEPDLPKQHFGGRASIPDELDPNQVCSRGQYEVNFFYCHMVD